MDRTPDAESLDHAIERLRFKLTNRTRERPRWLAAERMRLLQLLYARHIIAARAARQEAA
jgi:hypothetical protein